MRKASLSKRPTISIVGPGNLGSALALTLSAAEYRVLSLAVRPERLSDRRTRALARRVGARMIALGKEPLESDIVWLTIPDDAIADAARHLAQSQPWKNKIVLHSSGALTSDELAPLRDKGARVATLHPMMTFVRGVPPEMAGVSFAVEGDAAAVRVARQIVEQLDASSFLIDKRKKVLYHAFGSFASPLVIALLASLEQVASAAGIRHRDVKPVMVPLLWQTLQNYLKKDAASAFSGPLMRGDVTTIRKHLAELKALPEIRQVYVALCRASLASLPVKNRTAIEKALR